VFAQAIVAARVTTTMLFIASVFSHA
jgi:hypothetical protein